MKRTKKIVSKRKLAYALILFEDNIDEEIKSIEIISSTRYRINGECFSYGLDGGYIVDISENKVEKSYPDPDW